MLFMTKKLLWPKFGKHLKKIVYSFYTNIPTYIIYFYWLNFEQGTQFYRTYSLSCSENICIIFNFY